MNSGNENSLTLIDSSGGVTMIDFESPRSPDSRELRGKVEQGPDTPVWPWSELLHERLLLP